MYTIYTLSDPRTGKVRYVGCTLNVKRRQVEHERNKEGNPHKRAWVGELKAQGLLPVLTVLEDGLKEPECFAREAYWIEQYIKQGAPLTSTRYTKNRQVSATHYVFTQGRYDYEVSLGRVAVLLDWHD